MLTEAGWTDVERTGYELTVAVPESALVDDGQLSYSRIPEERREEAWAAVQAQLATFAQPGGAELQVPIAFQVFTARSSPAQRPQG